MEIEPDSHQTEPIQARLSPLTVVALEFLVLFALSIAFTYLVSNQAASVFRPIAPCDLGLTELVPYVSHNKTRFCSIPSGASQLAAVYFFLVALVLVASELGYRRAQSRPASGVSRLHAIGVGLLFWITILVWFFGLTGRLGDYEFLTQSLYFRATILSFVASLSQFLMSIVRQNRSR